MIDLLKLRELLYKIKTHQSYYESVKETAKCLQRIKRPSDDFNVDSRIKNLEDNNIRVYYKIN